MHAVSVQKVMRAGSVQQGPLPRAGKVLDANLARMRRVQVAQADAPQQRLLSSWLQQPNLTMN